MLRNLLIYLSKAEWMNKIFMNWGIARKVALRFVAGEGLEDAILVVKQLNAAGMIATLDQLGEDTDSADMAKSTGEHIIWILNTIQKSGVKSNLSLKLNQIGLSLDFDLCARILEDILKHAQSLGNFVRIDMEDSTCVDATIKLYKMMREKGYDNLGMVMQSYLYRCEADTKALLDQGCTIRLVKGAYKEPADVAYPKKKDVDYNFIQVMAVLLDASLEAGSPVLSKDGKWPAIPAAATHDGAMVDFTKAYATKIGLPKNKLEFQMLYGIRRDLQYGLMKEGYPVRVYVPFGTEWYPYFMRRLAERPANIWFFISNLFKK
jgi:proline dehydrogenase